VVDAEQLGRLAVDLEPPLRVAGVAEHQQPVALGSDRDLDPGLVALDHLDVWGGGRLGQHAEGLFDHGPLEQGVAGLEPVHPVLGTRNHVQVIPHAGQGWGGSLPEQEVRLALDDLEAVGARPAPRRPGSRQARSRPGRTGWTPTPRDGRPTAATRPRPRTAPPTVVGPAPGRGARTAAPAASRRSPATGSTR